MFQSMMKSSIIDDQMASTVYFPYALNRCQSIPYFLT